MAKFVQNIDILPLGRHDQKGCENRAEGGKQACNHYLCRWQMAITSSADVRSCVRPSLSTQVSAKRGHWVGFLVGVGIHKVSCCSIPTITGGSSRQCGSNRRGCGFGSASAVVTPFYPKGWGSKSKVQRLNSFPMRIIPYYVNIRFSDNHMMLLNSHHCQKSHPTSMPV